MIKSDFGMGKDYYVNMDEKRASVKNVEVLRYVNMDEKRARVKNVEELRYVNMDEERARVKNVEELRYVNIDDKKASVKNVEELRYVNMDEERARVKNVEDGYSHLKKLDVTMLVSIYYILMSSYHQNTKINLNVQEYVFVIHVQ